MLDLVRLSPRLLFPPGGEDLYRQIALLADLSEDQEILDVACGNGVALEYFVREHGARGSGVDLDATMVEQAEERVRRDGFADRLQFQAAPPDELPYRDGIFDVVVGELGLAARCEPADAVRELVRVARPGGFVVLVQLVWRASVEPARRRVLSEHLGARPLMLVEWKKGLKEAGVAELHTEDWSGEETAFRPRAAKPLPDFTEMFTLPQKIGILRRAWRRWGWTGVRTALRRAREVHRLLARERILGLDLVVGRKGGVASERAEAAAESGAPSPATEHSSRRDLRGEEEAPGGAEQEGAAETVGLPLFGGRATEA